MKTHGTVHPRAAAAAGVLVWLCSVAVLGGCQEATHSTVSAANNPTGLDLQIIFGANVGASWIGGADWDEYVNGISGATSNTAVVGGADAGVRLSRGLTYVTLAAGAQLMSGGWTSGGSYASYTLLGIPFSGEFGIQLPVWKLSVLVFAGLSTRLILAGVLESKASGQSATSQRLTVGTDVTDGTAFIPLGVGLLVPVSSKLSLDLSIGYDLPLDSSDIATPTGNTGTFRGLWFRTQLMFPVGAKPSTPSREASESTIPSARPVIAPPPSAPPPPSPGQPAFVPRVFYPSQPQKGER